LRPRETLSGLLTVLGLEAGSEVIDGMLADSQIPRRPEHLTAATPEASIGRWQTELDADLLAACEAAFGPAIEGFGYSG
jgi:hypothetical protein